MLSEKKNIDQLFRDKLQNYESLPPVFLWDRIETDLDVRTRRGKILSGKAMGIAAAVLVAFFAGWWLNNPHDLKQNQVTQNVTSLTEPTGIIRESQPVLPVASSEKGNDILQRKSFIPSTSSIASFATNVSFLKKDVDNSSTEKGEVVLFDIEKEFLSRFETKKEFLRKITGLSGDKINRADKIINNVNIIKSHNFFEMAKLSQAIRNDIPVDPEGDKTKNKARWSLSVEASPLITRGIENKGSQRTSAENTISGGFLAGVNIGKRVTVKSGVILSQLKQLTNNIGLSSLDYANGSIANTVGVSTPSGPIVVKHQTIVNGNMTGNNFLLIGLQTDIEQQFDYLEIPFLATYKIIDKKLSLGVTGGVSSNILTGNKASFSGSGNNIKIGETANLRNVTYSGAVGLEMGYELGNKVSVFIEPRVKHFFNSLSSNAAVNFRPYQIGVFTGLTYSFN